MEYLIRLSGEHPSLPLAELRSVLEGEGIGYDTRVYGRHIILETDSVDKK